MDALIFTNFNGRIKTNLCFKQSERTKYKKLQKKMPKILGAKAGKLSQMDALYIAGVKILSERIFAMFIGNGTLVSGGAKMLGAIGVNKMVGGKISDILSTAMTVDGAEDIVLSFMPKISGGLFGGVKSEVEII